MYLMRSNICFLGKSSIISIEFVLWDLGGLFGMTIIRLCKHTIMEGSQHSSGKIIHLLPSIPGLFDRRV